MALYSFKYGLENKEIDIVEKDILKVLLPKELPPIHDVKGEVIRAIENPIASPPLKSIVKVGERVVVVVSDITRLWIKSHLFLEPIIDYLNILGIKDENISILIALGSHRPSTEDEKEAIVGKGIYQRIKIYDHNSYDIKGLTYIGDSSYNTPIYINNRILEADRVILTGGIVYHLFAGFGGGAKSMVPGVAGIETIQHNHRLTFNNEEGAGLNPKAASNKIYGNPMREDITEICRAIAPDFLLNAVLDTEGRFVKFVAGDFEAAWIEGCGIIRDLYGIGVEERADIVIASAGGFPKDINLYQTVKTMDNCLYGGKENSVIILLTECREGLGATEFMDWFQHNTLEDMEVALKKNFTVPGYAAYKTAYTGIHRRVILISSLAEEVVKRLGFIPAISLNEALEKAKVFASKGAKIMLMPYGGNTLPIDIGN